MSYDVYDAEPYAVYNEKVVTARKLHTCHACDELISPGYHYVRLGMVFDGHAKTIKRCMRCQRLHEHLRVKGAKMDMYPAERLDCGETYQDHWGEDPPDDIAALAFALPGET